MENRKRIIPAEMRVNTAEIPSYVRDRLAVATMAYVRGLMQQPESRAALEARVAADANK